MARRVAMPFALTSATAALPRTARADRMPAHAHAPRIRGQTACIAASSRKVKVSMLLHARSPLSPLGQQASQIILDRILEAD